jgi:hypothetical protein
MTRLIDPASVVTVSGLDTTLSTVSSTISGTLKTYIDEYKTQIFIPTPKLVAYNGSSNIAAKWNSSDKTFLQHNPKYYLFRYRGKGKHNVSGQSIPKRKGYFHPVHQNGANANTSGWWASLDCDNQGRGMPGRDTEWDISTEGNETPLTINFEDWMYIVNGGSFPQQRSNLRVRSGRSTKTFMAYFCLCIAIEVPNSTGCPVVFGPASEMFAIKPRSMGSDLYDRYIWVIGV